MSPEEEVDPQAARKAQREFENAILEGPRTEPRMRDELLTINDLVFVGLNGYAVALDRDSGEIVWSNDKMRGGYVTLLLDGDRLICSTNGYMYCLDPLTGSILWHNPMTGYGVGSPTALVSVRGLMNSSLIHEAAAQEAASAAARTAASTNIIAGS